MDDLPPYPTKIDLVFESLARLAGAREAERAIDRSAQREQSQRKPDPLQPKKIQSAS